MPPLRTSDQVNLPTIVSGNTSALAQITQALGVPRTILASDDEIDRTWGQLPRLLSRIPAELRSEQHARMCVAVSAGLFDAGINYAWNSAVIELRNKVQRFGFNVVEQLTTKDFDQDALDDLQDSELLDLCLKLNLISEDAYFFLDQSRDTRNNFSSAHPPMGQIDDDEFIVFLSRCAKYALNDTSNPTGVDTVRLISGLKGGRFKPEQTAEWCQRIQGTHDAQRELIFSTLHGIYCDPDASEEARLNAIDICRTCSNQFSPSARSQLLNRHSDYVANGDAPRQTASRLFFEQMNLLKLLTEVERHSIVSTACQRLVTVHHAYNNFYNEPPFAQRLSEIVSQTAVPQSCQSEYVETVVMCAVGNQYGVCNAALPAYRGMISNFSPNEVAIMLKLPPTRTIVGERIKVFAQCAERYKSILENYCDAETVPTSVKSQYEKWVS
jgi:hypothetical protein